MPECEYCGVDCKGNSFNGVVLCKICRTRATDNLIEATRELVSLRKDEMAESERQVVKVKCPACDADISVSVDKQRVYVLNAARPLNMKDQCYVTLRRWSLAEIVGLVNSYGIVNGLEERKIKEIDLTPYDPDDPHLDPKDDYYKGVVKMTFYPEEE
jgi:hypothetical protein